MYQSHSSGAGEKWAGLDIFSRETRLVLLTDEMWGMMEKAEFKINPRFGDLSN